MIYYKVLTPKKTYIIVLTLAALENQNYNTNKTKKTANRTYWGENTEKNNS